MKLPFIGGSAEGRSPKVSIQACKNLFPEAVTGGQSGAIYWTPGLEKFYGAPAAKRGRVRGLLSIGTWLYAVIKDHAYRISKAGVATELGEVGGSTNPVHMAWNGKEVCIVVQGGNGFIVDDDHGKLKKITSDGFPGNVGSVTAQDGYFIAHDYDSGAFMISGLYDGMTWDALDFASAEGNPDKIVRCLCDHRELWLFGTDTCEIWYNSGASDYPFTRVSGGFTETGCIAPASCAKIDNTVFWLTSRKQVARADGYVPIIISTREIEHQIDAMTQCNDAIGFSYSWEGHETYFLTFPTGNKTFAYDVSTQIWHQRTSYPNEARHRANCYAYFNGYHMIGDHENGKIYKWLSSVYQDDGEPIIRELVTQHIREEGKRIFYHRCQVEMEVGHDMPSTAEILAGDELILNPSFETYTEPLGTVDFENWDENITNPQVSTIVFYDGLASVYLPSTQCGDGMRKIVSLAAFALTPGLTYSFSVWSKGDGTNAGSYIITKDTEGGTTLLTGATAFSATWTQTTGTFVCPAGCTGGILTLNGPSTGDIYYDLASLTASGTPGTPAVEPMVMLSWSDDGGYTWSNEHWRSIGKIGERSKRVIWHRMGAARERAYKMRYSENSRFVILSAYLDVSVGAD